MAVISNRGGGFILLPVHWVNSIMVGVYTLLPATTVNQANPSSRTLVYATLYLRILYSDPDDHPTQTV